MRKVSITIVLLLVNLIVLAQQNNRPGGFSLGTVKGKVIDATTKQPIDYANITLFNPKDSSVVTGGISNESGVFQINDVRPGRFYAKVTFIGYKTNLVRNITITPTKNTVDLGTISITSAAVNLNEVVVKGDKDMVVTNLDKQVINVDKDLSSSGGTALDVMQNIPALTVDIDGNVSLRGNSNVTILIDGKPSGLSGLQSSDVLTAIPSSSIKSVELVTNPSAKYDPDGTAGIINIVLKKKSNLGLNGIFNVSAGTGSKYNGSANLNYRTGDLNFFGNFGGRLSNDSRVGFTNRTFYNTGYNSYLNQNSSSAQKGNMANINLGTDYLLNDVNTFSFNFQYRQFYAPSGGSTNNTTVNDFNNNSIDYYATINNATRLINSYNYTTSYKKEFDQKDQVLTADVIYSNNSMNSDASTNNIFYSDGRTSSLIDNKTNNYNNEWTVQANYVNPLGDSNRLEAGFKSYFRHMGMDYNFYNFDPNTNELVNNSDRSNNFDYKEQIHAIYGIYSGATGNLKYQAGLRGEYASTDSKLLNNDLAFKNTYRSLYPSAYLAYDFTPLQELKINYSRRVDRPNPWQINPFINYSDSLNLSSGNPDLQPQYTNSYEFGYSTILFDFNITSSLFYKQTDGLMTRINTFIGNGVTETTWENISNQKNYGGEFIGNGSLFPWWRLNGNVSYYRRDINDANYTTNGNTHSYNWSARINSTWLLSKTFSFQISSTYNSKSVTTQGTNNAMYFTDLAIKNDFSRDLSMTLRVSDIFDTRKFAGETIGTNFISYSEGHRISRAVFLGFTYNINNYKPSKDKVKDINMDEEMNAE
jgi:outer membrane receptor protein involved in Fe transport